MTEEKTLYCSFCGKSQHEVKKLIVGPSDIGICDECTGVCTCICIEESLRSNGLWFMSRERPLDSREIIKQVVRELREEDAQGTETGTAETTGSVGEADDGPVAESDAQGTQS